MKRRPEIDALRGLMLVLMTLTHLPTRLSGPLGQPLGFVSAAEGFVFLSAFMAGLISSRQALNSGVLAMCKAFWLRGLKLYACHVAMLLYLFTLIAAIGIKTDQQSIKNLISFYLREPLTALMSSLLLIYNPPLLDILPMYVAFMVMSPLILTIGLRTGWTAILIVSGMIWFLAQFGIEKEIYQAARNFTAIKVPFHETGAFDILAWQLIWVLGLSLGAELAASSAPTARIPLSIIYSAMTVAFSGFAARHLFGQSALDAYPHLATLLNKWHLGPIRLLNFFALLILTLRYGETFKTTIQFRFLERLGTASLAVFCAHLAVVLLALALIGDKKGAIPFWQEIALISLTLCVMYGTAWIFRNKAKHPIDLTSGNPAVSARAAR